MKVHCSKRTPSVPERYTAPAVSGYCGDCMPQSPLMRINSVSGKNSSKETERERERERKRETERERQREREVFRKHCKIRTNKPQAEKSEPIYYKEQRCLTRRERHGGLALSNQHHGNRRRGM